MQLSVTTGKLSNQDQRTVGKNGEHVEFCMYHGSCLLWSTVKNSFMILRVYIYVSVLRTSASEMLAGLRESISSKSRFGRDTELPHVRSEEKSSRSAAPLPSVGWLMHRI